MLAHWLTPREVLEITRADPIPSLPPRRDRIDLPIPTRGTRTKKALDKSMLAGESPTAYCWVVRSPIWNLDIGVVLDHPGSVHHKLAARTGAHHSVVWQCSEGRRRMINFDRRRPLPEHRM